MGTDDLYHKRKKRARDIRSYSPRSPKRSPYERILIVCEGQTELNYLKNLREDLRLPQENVSISLCPKGNDALSIARYTSQKLIDEKDYDRGYSVFDGEHLNYLTACNHVKLHFDKQIPIYAIPSIPSFEYWILLHYTETTKPYRQKGKKSPGDQLCSEVKKYLPSYQKGQKNLYENTKDKLKIAIERAQKIDLSQNRDKTDNPLTKFHELVEYLINIRKSS